MRYLFSKANFLANESMPVSEWRGRERACAVMYWRLVILVFGLVVWGLDEEDVENRLRHLGPRGQQLLQCPICGRQRS
jgi:hypothetical protein